MKFERKAVALSGLLPLMHRCAIRGVPRPVHLPAARVLSSESGRRKLSAPIAARSRHPGFWELSMLPTRQTPCNWDLTSYPFYIWRCASAGKLFKRQRFDLSSHGDGATFSSHFREGDHKSSLNTHCKYMNTVIPAFTHSRGIPVLYKEDVAAIDKRWPKNSKGISS
jgi:hypothetical protein